MPRRSPYKTNQYGIRDKTAAILPPFITSLIVSENQVGQVLHVRKKQLA